MKILSIDVGIKNLAICILETNSNNNNYKICYWNIINLCNNSLKICNKCNKNARFYKDNIYLCNYHAKKDKYKIPTLHDNINKINKLNINELKTKASLYDISFNNSILKIELNKLIIDYLKKEYFEIIVEDKAADINIINIGINLKTNFDMIIENFVKLDSIIIENQISPIANRMKTIQGMIAQYFIMHNYKNIEFISAQNKLKLFCDKKKTSYNERKKLSIEFCKDLLIKNNKSEINYFLQHKKKDDLADCFLQGIYYLINNKVLNI
jgi:hypothetical protein